MIVAGDLGGAERLVATLANRVEGSGADHAVALMTSNPKVEQLFLDSNVSVHRCPKPDGPVADLWRSFGPVFVAWLQDILQRERADLVHAHTFGSHLIAVRAGARLGLPVMRTEHGVTHYGDLSCAPFRHWTARRTTRIVAVSDYVARTVARWIPEIASRIRVIPNGIDTEHFQPQGNPPEGGPFTFAITARLVPWKQIHIALQALAQIPGIRLDVAGEGTEMERLRRLAFRLGIGERVRFLGFSSDPRSVIASSHAVLNCSRDEGLPLAVLEAASMERPCVAFPVGGTVEVVRHGATGWLAEGRSVESFANAMRAACADRARAAKFGREARKRVLDIFALEGMCRAYADLYAELTGRDSMAAVA